MLDATIEDYNATMELVKGLAHAPYHEGRGAVLYQGKSYTLSDREVARMIEDDPQTIRECYYCTRPLIARLKA